VWTKICGIRDPETALEVVRAGADAIGLNFYAKSPRAVAPAHAAEIVAALPAGTTVIGLFVNHPLAEVRAIAQQCRLTTIQLHGDEPPQFLAGLREYQVIRAFRMGPAGLAPLEEYLHHCRSHAALPHACLIDAHVAGEYGGTGKTVPWDRLREEYRADWPRLILAGGLNPENVAHAVQLVQPWGVDTASGVETAPGVKDLARVRQFIAAARERAAGAHG